MSHFAAKITPVAHTGATIVQTAIPDARSPAVLGIAPRERNDLGVTRWLLRFWSVAGWLIGPRRPPGAGIRDRQSRFATRIAGEAAPPGWRHGRGIRPLRRRARCPRR